MASLYKIKGKLYALRGKLVKLDARDPFTIKINTALGNGFNSFTLPLSNHAINVKVRTSDGQSFTITNYLDPARTINFATAGVYTIELRGFCGWSFGNTGDCQKLIGVKWGSSFKFSYLTGGFNGCINLGLYDGLPDKGYIMSYTKNISCINLFKDCNLSSLGHDKLFNKVNILSAQSMLERNKLTYISADVFKGQINIGNANYMLRDNPTLLDMHKDCYKDMIRLSTAQEMHTRCGFKILRKQWLHSFNALTIARAMFSSCNIESIEEGSFDKLTNCTDLSIVLYNNRLSTIPNRLFFNTKKVTNYNRSLERQRTKMTLPSEIWDLSAISIVTNWNTVLAATNTTLSPTGTVQPIWDYASPTATKVDALNDCTALTNYNDSPLDWR